jgi:hypothetical protein
MGHGRIMKAHAVWDGGSSGYQPERVPAESREIDVLAGQTLRERCSTPAGP